MGRLRAAMQDRYKNRDEDVKIHTPRNLEPLELTFRGERVAKVTNAFHHAWRMLISMNERQLVHLPPGPRKRTI